MNTFQINKILGLVLGTLLFLQVAHIVDEIFTPAKLAKAGSEVAVKEAAPAEVPIENLLASASVDKGAQTAKQCGICHNFEEGQGSKIGPDLYGTVGRAVASVPGFNYSAALKALKAKGGTWTFDALNKWLTKPGAYVPGTAMTFAGLSNEKQRADVIAYLNSLSAKPLPLPTAKGAAAANAPASAPAAPPAAAAGNPPASAPAPAAPGGEKR